MHGMVLTYGGERQNLEGFTDADGASQDHHQAISGYAFIMDGGAISWSLRKQELMTLSIAEVEYVAGTHTANECIDMQQLSAALGVPEVYLSVLLLYYSSEGTL
jgi:hypothetical protein